MKYLILLVLFLASCSNKIVFSGEELYRVGVPYTNSPLNHLNDPFNDFIEVFTILTNDGNYVQYEEQSFIRQDHYVTTNSEEYGMFRFHFVIHKGIYKFDTKNFNFIRGTNELKVGLIFTDDFAMDETDPFKKAQHKYRTYEILDIKSNFCKMKDVNDKLRGIFVYPIDQTYILYKTRVSN